MHGCNTRFGFEIKKDGAISLWFIDWTGKKKLYNKKELDSARKRDAIGINISSSFPEFRDQPAKKNKQLLLFNFIGWLLKEKLPTQFRRNQIFTFFKMSSC